MSKKTKDLNYLAMSAMLRAREANMLGRDRMDRMLAAGSYGEAAKLLAECGYEDLSDADAAGVDAALTRRRAAVFEELAGMAPQPEVVDIFRLKYDYHNLKTLVKAAGAQVSGDRLLSDCGRVPADKLKAAVEEMLDMVGLTEYRSYYPDQLSASMLQRVVIARAFATKPELLLMDEPYGQLDIELRFKLEDELINIWEKLGTTIIFITHNIEEAVYISEDILVLTNKPTKIKERMPNPLPRPRCVTDLDFIEVRERVTDLIKWW